MKKGTLILGLCIMACFIMFAANSYAAAYECTIDRVISQDNGRVFVTVVAAAGETGFTGTARVYFDASTAAGKNMLATLLTAVSMDIGVVLSCDSVPEYWTPKELKGVGLYLN